MVQVDTDYTQDGKVIVSLQIACDSVERIRDIVAKLEGYEILRISADKMMRRSGPGAKDVSKTAKKREASST